MRDSMTTGTQSVPQNRFHLAEWSGAFGDLGTLLPIAFALVTFNGFPVARIFFLWGLAYIATGWFFKVPVSVQPLKAMAIVAISAGIPADRLAETAVWYGLLLLLISWTGVIGWLHRLFSRPIVRGIQLGIGLILAKKAVAVALDNGMFLHMDRHLAWVSLAGLGLAVLAVMVMIRRKLPVGLLVLATGVALALWMGADLPVRPEGMMEARLPGLDFLWTAIPLLIIPQLPLTLGNAVFAADDAAHTLWKDQAKRVTPKRLAVSIGLCDVGIGLLGGFPICHGAGGMGAHERFGARTGGATIIMGAVLVLLALVPGGASVLFLIPVPVLGAMLLVDGVRMAMLTRQLDTMGDMWIAAAVGGVSVLTRNLTLGLLAGLLMTGLVHGIRKLAWTIRPVSLDS